MGARAMIAGAAVGAALLGGCGGGSHGAATDGAATTTTGGSLAPAPPPPGIAGRLLTRNELAGFTGQPNQVQTTIQGWLADTSDSANEVASDRARFTRLGFVQAIRENLADQAGDDGVSQVEQFRTAAGARGELAFLDGQVKQHSLGPGQYTSFEVPAVPGAIGFAITQSGQGGLNVAFVKGPDYYLVGRTVASGSPQSEIAGLVAAARHLYGRVSA